MTDTTHLQCAGCGEIFVPPLIEGAVVSSDDCEGISCPKCDRSHIERVFRYEIGIGVFNPEGLERLILHREARDD